MFKLSLQNISVLACYFFCTAAFAAEQAMDDFFSMSPLELANISVSIATGTAKPVYQSAAVTTVITADQIKTMGATELSQVLETVPGLHVSIQAVTNDPTYSMRGIQNPVNNQVLVMLNGTRYSVPYKGSSMTGLEIPVKAIQKIEVIRGPGSALYGADAFAGVINIVTKKAKDIDGTEIGVRGGSWDTQSIWGLHSNQWLGWDIATTLQYSHNNNDGDRIIKSDAQSAFDVDLGTNASLAPGEMQTQSERWNAHLNLQRQYWDVNFWAFNEVDQGLRAGAGGALDDKGDLNGENYLTDLRFNSENLIEDWEFLVHGSYLYTGIEANTHVFPDGTRLPIDNRGELNPNPMVPTRRVLFPDGVIDNIAIENQVVSIEIGSIYKGLENHLLRLTTGFRYEQVRVKESRNIGNGILIGNPAIVDGSLTRATNDNIFLPDSQRTIWSVSMQDEWQVSQDWSFTAGIRYDEYSDFGTTINPRFALVWNVNEQLSAKLLYGQAYRAPSFLEQKQNNLFFTGNPDVDPETIETVEMAFDYRPYNNLRLASNFYFYQIDDLISGSTDGASQVENTAGQTGYGAEFEWDWKLHQQWNLKGNYAWQYARNEETKSRVRGVPEHQIYSALVWEFLPKWRLQTQLNWLGHMINIAEENERIKDYETVDITLNSRRFLNHIGFTASVHNVFDSQGKEASSSSYPDNLPVPSRSFYLETTINF